MNKVFIYPCIFVFLIANASCSNEAKTTNDNTSDDFQELSEPERKVSGAYYGIGLGISKISNKLNATKNSGNPISFKRSANQYDVSIISGFGSAFYERYYAGVELEFFKRLPEKTKQNGEIGIVHKSNMGFNMDVRFGYQLPQHGMLVYATAGFARVIGSATFYKINETSPCSKVSFGSFYPTFGVGAEYKMNHQWNIRGDLRVSVTSKDDNKSLKIDNATEWKFDGKPNRCAFRVSVTRNI